MLWLLGGYMWLFIHRPFEVWPWLAELHIERMYMIVTILWWAVAGDKQWVRNRLNVAFAFFWAVLLAAWIASPYSAQGTETVENYFKIAVFYILVMSTVRSEKDLKLLVMMFLGAMGLYMAHSLWEYHNGRHWHKMGTVRMVGVDLSSNDPNSFAATVVYSLPMVFPLWFVGKWRQTPRQMSTFIGSDESARSYSTFFRSLRWALVGYMALAVTCVLLTGSRGSFVGLSALAMIVVLLSKHRMIILLLLAIALPVAWSLLPEDRQNRYLTLWDASYGPKSAQESAEGRTTKGLLDGIRLWKERPVLGVGPGVFGTATGLGYQAHHLYGQVVGELGTLGALAWCCVLLAFGLNLREANRLFRANLSAECAFCYQVCVGVSVVVILLLIQGLGSHCLYRSIWLWFGAFEAVAVFCMNSRIADTSASDEECMIGDAEYFCPRNDQYENIHS
jgi:O-antigen ligase